MGVVYRAWDPWLECIVAIKLLSEDRFPDETIRQQLLTEARIASSLTYPKSHSAICRIKTVEEHSGEAGIIMEWVDGQILTHVIPAEVGLTPIHVVRYGIEIADAVAHAHERGVIHRDLKSGNVMVTPDGHIKLLDFGLSRIQSRIEVPNELETAEFESSSEAIVGTPPYWAPEVLRREPVDARTDIWSLGVVLYEMAAGRMPFTGATVFELASAILKEKPAPLPSRVPTELSSVIDRCLQKNAVHRYQRATEVRAALEAIDNSEGGEASRLRHRQEPAPRLPSVAVLPLENHSADAQQEYFADGLTEALITTLTKLGGLRVISRTSVMSYRHTTKTLRQIARELSVDAIVEGSVLRDGDRVRINAELIDARLDQLLWAESYERDLRDILALQSQVASAIAGEIRVKLSPQYGDFLGPVPSQTDISSLPLAENTTGSLEASGNTSTQVNPKAYDLYLQARYFWNNHLIDQDFKAAEFYQKAIEIDPNSALAHAGLANSFIRMVTAEYGLVAPVEIMPRAKSNALKAISLDESLAEGHVALAMLQYRFEQDWAGADKEFARAIELKDGDASAHYAYSVYLMLLSRFDDALREVKVAQNLNPLSPAIHFSLGLLLYLSRQFEEAVVQLRETIAKYPEFPLARLVLGLTFMHKGMSDEAASEIKAAMDLAGPIPLWQGFLAQTYANAGRKPEALTILRELRQASASKAKLYVPPTALALVEGSLGEVDQAFSSLERAVKERDGLLIYLKVGAVFDGLRSDKRFVKILSRVGLQEDPQLDVRHPEGPVPEPPIPVPLPSPFPRPWWSRRTILRSVAAAVVVVATLVWSPLPLKVVVKKIYGYFVPQPKVMLAIDTFKNLGSDSEALRLGSGVKENLFTQLSQLAPATLGVIEMSPADAGLSLAQKCEHARADYVLTGGVEGADKSVVVTDQLMSCKDYTLVVGGRHEGNLSQGSIIAIEIRIAEEIAGQILAALPTDKYPEYRVNPRAYEAYLKGRYLWAQRTPDSLTKALSFFQQAIGYDSKYAPSYAGLADCYALLASVPNTTLPPNEAFPKAKQNAQQALKIDPNLAEAHVSLGYSELVYDRNYTEAAKEFETALRLRPNYATSHQYYAYYLTAMGRIDEAIAQRKQAVDLEPASPLLNAALGEAYYQAHNFDGSILHNQEALSLDSHYAVAIINIGRSYEQKKMYPQALAAFQSILPYSPNDPVLLAFLGHIYAVSGKTVQAQKIASDLQKMRNTRYVPSLYIALVYTGLGKRNDAFYWLNQAYDEHCEYLVYLPTEPLADPLRGDPRFDDLLQRLGLPKIRSGAGGETIR